MHHCNKSCVCTPGDGNIDDDRAEESMTGEERNEDEEEGEESSNVDTVPSSENQEDKSSKVTETVDIPEELPCMSGCGLPSHGNWLHYTWLCDHLPGRELQLQVLLTLLGEV